MYHAQGDACVLYGSIIMYLLIIHHNRHPHHPIHNHHTHTHTPYIYIKLYYIVTHSLVFHKMGVSSSLFTQWIFQSVIVSLLWLELYTYRCMIPSIYKQMLCLSKKCSSSAPYAAAPNVPFSPTSPFMH